MAVVLSGDTKEQALALLGRYCAEELDLELSGIQAASLLAYILKEIAPTAYNAGIDDARTFLRDRLAHLEATCYEPEFVHWPKGSSVRRK